MKNICLCCVIILGIVGCRDADTNSDLENPDKSTEPTADQNTPSTQNQETQTDSVENVEACVAGETVCQENSVYLCKNGQYHLYDQCPAQGFDCIMVLGAAECSAGLAPSASDSAEDGTPDNSSTVNGETSDKEVATETDAATDDDINELSTADNSYDTEIESEQNRPTDTASTGIDNTSTENAPLCTNVIQDGVIKITEENNYQFESILDIESTTVKDFDMTIEELEENFLFLRELATGWWSGDVIAGETMDLDSLVDEDGFRFEGLKNDGSIWLVATMCNATCNCPAPWSITILEPCS